MAENPLGALQDLGFTESESRVYLTLLSSPPTTGYQVSVRAGIPRSMVYEALGRLESRGAVLRAGDHRGTRYRPVPPEALLDHLEQSYHQKVASLRSDLGSRFHGQEDDRFWSGRGRELAYGLARQLLEAAERELLVVLADPEVELLAEGLEAATARGLRVAAIFTGELTVPCGLGVRHPRRESEIQQLDRLLLMVADGQQVLIADLRGEIAVTLTSNSHMILIARQFVWMELLTQRLNASGAPDPLAPLPAEERRFLEAIGLAPGFPPAPGPRIPEAHR
jgi:Cd2+/Zn2+-exporting ATPase